MRPQSNREATAKQPNDCHAIATQPPSNREATSSYKHATTKQLPINRLARLAIAKQTLAKPRRPLQSTAGKGAMQTIQLITDVPAAHDPEILH